ncbi:MAG: T9SS type A sorting domain-containing protein, partial [Hymenobacteraceae bacterium]|nr:T9SS type A sorting domain-containing protein [Hymenobacteraceae bacterium]
GLQYSYFDQTPATAYGHEDFFLVKFDSSGIIQWLKTGGSRHDVRPPGVASRLESIASIAADTAGNVTVLGLVQDSAYFDSTLFVGSYFMARYNKNGVLQWVKPIIDDQYITTDLSGSIYTANNSGTTRKVARYDATNGAEIWRKFEHTYGGYIEDLTTDSQGYAYVLFSVKDSARFSNGTTLYGTGNVTAKYDTAGNMLWARLLPRTLGQKITTDSSDNIYVGGMFGGTITLSNSTLTSRGGYDVLVVRYTPSGQLAGCLSAGGSQDDFLHSIGVSRHGVTVTGGSNNAWFDTNYLPGHQVFIALADFSTVSGAVKGVAENPLMVYPNPANEIVQVQLPEPQQQQTLLKLLDLQGRQVLVQTVEAGTTTATLHLQQLSKGCYLVQVQTPQQLWHQKLIIE